MEQKCHYKLYKSGKLWGTALISTALLGGLATTAHADTQETVKAQPSPNQQATVTTSASQSLTSAKSVVLEEQHDQNTQPQSTPSQVTTKANDQKQAAAASDHQEQVASPTPAEHRNVAPTAAQTNSTVTVANPTNYPQAAAALVGKNSQGQPYYVFQVVSWTINWSILSRASWFARLTRMHPKGQSMFTSRRINTAGFTRPLQSFLANQRGSQWGAMD